MTLNSQNVKDCIVKIVEKKSFVKDIFHDVHKAGGRILLVGGAVRDFFLQKESADYDFEVYGLSIEELYNILKKHGAVSLVGKSFGVLRLSTFDADFSLPRKDSSGRKPEVYIDENMSYAEAFRRRDLTINAMGIDAVRYELIDPFNGLIDLQAGVLRSPDLSLFAEDPLRLFRVMQFAGRFNFSVDRALTDLCRTVDTNAVSRERVEDEFAKLWLRSKKPSVGLRWLAAAGRTQEIFPEVDWSEKLYQVVDSTAQSRFDTEQNKLIFAWASFFLHLKMVQKVQINIHQPVDHSIVMEIEKSISEHLLPVDQKRAIVSLIVYVNRIPLLVEKGDQRDYKWLAWWIRKHSSLDHLYQLGQSLFDEKIVNKFFDAAESAGVLKSPEEPLVMGSDLVEHCQPGPELGNLVAAAYQLQIDESIKDKKHLLQKIMMKK